MAPNINNHTHSPAWYIMAGEHLLRHIQILKPQFSIKITGYPMWCLYDELGMRRIHVSSLMRYDYIETWMFRM